MYQLIAKDKVSLLYQMPVSAQITIFSAWEKQYEDLYEPEADGTVFLEDVLQEILDLFDNESRAFGHIRYVWMSLIFAVLIEPKIKYYQPENDLPRKTIDRLKSYIVGEVMKNFGLNLSRFDDSNDDSNTDKNMELIHHIFTSKKISSLQILSDALCVYISANQMIDSSHLMKPALMDILDDCLEGYAIFPGSDGRRKLFDWWLLDIVPSSWYLLPPMSVWGIDDLVNPEILDSLNRLKEFSCQIRSILKSLQYNDGKHGGEFDKGEKLISFNKRIDENSNDRLNLNNDINI